MPSISKISYCSRLLDIVRQSDAVLKNQVVSSLSTQLLVEIYQGGEYEHDEFFRGGRTGDLLDVSVEGM